MNKFKNTYVTPNEDNFVNILDEDGEIVSIGRQDKFESLTDAQVELNAIGLRMNQQNENAVEIDPNYFRTRAIEAVASKGFTPSVENIVDSVVVRNNYHASKEARQGAVHLQRYLKAVVRQTLENLEQDADNYNQFLNQNHYFETHVLPQLTIKGDKYAQSEILNDSVKAGQRVLSINIKNTYYNDKKIPAARFSYPIHKIGSRWFFIRSFTDQSTVHDMGFKTITEAVELLQSAWNDLIAKLLTTKDANPEMTFVDIAKQYTFHNLTQISILLYAEKLDNHDWS